MRLPRLGGTNSRTVDALSCLSSMPGASEYPSRLKSAGHNSSAKTKCPVRSSSCEANDPERKALPHRRVASDVGTSLEGDGQVERASRPTRARARGESAMRRALTRIEKRQVSQVCSTRVEPLRGSGPPFRLARRSWSRNNENRTHAICATWRMRLEGSAHVHRLSGCARYGRTWMVGRRHTSSRAPGLIPRSMPLVASHKRRRASSRL